MSPLMGMRRIASRDRLKMLSPGSLFNTDAAVSPANDVFHSMDKIKRVSSSSSISHSSLPSLSYGSIYMKLWHGLTTLDSDPHHGIRHMSRIITSHVRDQVKESSAPKELGETKLSSSLSLPPSPSSRPSFLAGESPPTTGSVSELHRLTSSRSAHLTSRTRKIMPNTISEEADDTCGVKQPLVTTQFVEWSCKYFAQPVMKFLEDNDIESSLYYEREWRYQRNFALRQEAKEEQSRISTGKLEHQVFNTRSPHPPSVIRFHPYETHIVVAGRDSFGIWDWLSGSKLNYCNNRASRNSRITSLDFINSHDVSLLIVGSDDGTVRVWSNYVSQQSQEPVLVTAWQALSDVQPVTKSPTAGAGMVFSWVQRSQRLVVTGDVRVIRLWDADTELKIQDIPTGADCCVTSIATDLSGQCVGTLILPEYGDSPLRMPGQASSRSDCHASGSLSVPLGRDRECSSRGLEPLFHAKSCLTLVGCGDGSVRLFDDRVPPHESRVMTWREHTGWVVDVSLRAESQGTGMAVSGCVAGDVRLYDLRRNSSVSTCQTSQGMTAMSVHSAANTFACGSVNQYISVYNMAGVSLNTIKYHEGFMGPRIGPVSCLQFHPHRVCLAAGSMDNSISIYSVDPKR
uniref:(California timema) hypothetical protein n=1 Tax=Timema californicum TaxID=61474 RepID=A0A7R9J964_TIMCA|nr:unnamed protein product [Timema californicum]